MKAGSLELGRRTVASTNEDHRIIVIGGYGHVGARIVASLAPRQPGRVVVAGRSLPLARKFATQVGHGTTARGVDITSPRDVELEGVDVVVVCVDQSSATFAQRCLSAGIHYVDITAGWEFLRTVEEFDDIARQAGATVLLSVGVAPGLTNQLATHLAKRLGPLRRLDILLELGLGDTHGTSAVDWMLDHLSTPYTVRMGGDEVVVRSLISLPHVRASRSPATAGLQVSSAGSARSCPPYRRTRGVHMATALKLVGDLAAGYRRPARIRPRTATTPLASRRALGARTNTARHRCLHHRRVRADG